IASVSAATLSLSTPNLSNPARAGSRVGNSELLDDRQMVAACVAGDAAAWEQIVRQHSRRIYNLCFRFTGRAEDADDLSQEVFVRLYRTLATYRAEQGSLGTWITSVTRNLLIDHYRRRKYERLTDSIDDAEAPIELVDRGDDRADRGVWRREVQEGVQRALLRLSPELREAVILRDLQDMDYKDIALALHLPEGTVKSRINRGRVELARLLKRRLGNASE
ncbi:MAG: RNA polymerase sigma factor, partial [Terriglobales bacterium]